MGIAERKKREREQRKKEILNAAESLFFSNGYDKVSMDAIADVVELNKATLYQYFKNKEALLSAVVLRGIRILNKMYQECADTQVPGITKVFLMGKTYFRWTQEHPEYQRLIRYYSLERFSEDNAFTPEIAKSFGESREFLSNAVREGIADGTIRDDMDPVLISTYLTVTSLSIYSLNDKWKAVLEEEGFSYETFVNNFFRFITPAVSTGEKPHTIRFDGSAGGPFTSLFLGADPVTIDPPKRKKGAGR